jgi:hypothetical protein
MADLPPEYFECAHAMTDAAIAWLQAHPDTKLIFKKLNPQILYAVALPPAIDMYAANAAARELLEVMEQASKGQATLHQARCIIDCLFQGQGHGTDDPNEGTH